MRRLHPGGILVVAMQTLLLILVVTILAVTAIALVTVWLYAEAEAAYARRQLRWRRLRRRLWQRWRP